MSVETNVQQYNGLLCLLLAYSYVLEWPAEHAVARRTKETTGSAKGPLNVYTQAGPYWTR